ncbi:MAG: hypothetical protein OSA51_12445 [Octadecabacter sp.]|nr:hypothetical protein [Octadecabacter sp.]
MTQKSCYGTMFPETLGGSADNGTVTGKVFGYDTAPRGLARPKRTPNVGTKEWEDCLQCEAFDSCHKLSSAKFAPLVAIVGPI